MIRHTPSLLAILILANPKHHVSAICIRGRCTGRPSIRSMNRRSMGVIMPILKNLDIGVFPKNRFFSLG